MSFNMRKAMLKTHKRLCNYCQTHSHKLWLNYKAFIEATNSVPKSFPNAMAVYEASINFHMMLMELCNDIEEHIKNKWERGTHHIIYGQVRVEIHLYADEFSILLHHLS